MNPSRRKCHKLRRTARLAAIAALGAAVMLAFGCSLARQETHTPIDSDKRLGQISTDKNLTFAVVGDVGTGGSDQAAVAGLLERMRPDLLLITGDVVYPDGGYDSYGPNFYAPYRDLIKTTPVFPVMGNHDVMTADGGPYLEIFRLPHDNPQNTERYYSFDVGNAHFAALDSELYYGDDGATIEEQKSWLENDLASTNKPWKFVYLHRPPYSSSQHGSDESIRRDLKPLFERYGVNVVFSGHDHDYERSVPIGGVTYVVSGGGGRELYPAGKSEWTAFSRSVHHAVRVRIEGDHLKLEAVSTDGSVMDSISLDTSTDSRGG